MKMRFVRLVSLATLVLWVVAVPSPHAKGKQSQPASKLDQYLTQVVETDPTRIVPVIIRGKFKPVAHIYELAASLGGVVTREYTKLGTIALTIPASSLPRLALDRQVQRISIDAPVYSVGKQEALLPTSLLLPTLGLPDPLKSGSSVRVAVIDSGIDDNDVIPVEEFYDFTRDGRKAKTHDDYGHGTHVAGLVRSRDTHENAPFQSVSRGARLVGFKVLQADGSGTTSDVLAALEFAIRYRAKLKIDVINLSLGHPIYEPAATDPLVQAVEEAVASGIVVVVAAGNVGINSATGEVGYAGITSPGNAPSAITVGAVDTRNTVTRLDDEVATYSSRGPTWYDAFAKPDIVAPGRRILSFVGRESYLCQQYAESCRKVGARTYMALSGTSMAAAVTTGAVAELIEANHKAHPGTQLTPHAIKAILEFTAVPIAGADALTQGAGSLNVAGALALTRAINPELPSGTWWLETGVAPTTVLVNGEVLAWGQQILWGDRALSGDYIYWNDQAWCKGVVWGDRLVWGTRIVWGTADESLVWGNRLVWGTRIVWGTNLLGYDVGGSVAYGDDIDWESVIANRLVWGTMAGVGAGSSGASGDDNGWR